MSVYAETVYEYDGSLASLSAGSLIDANLINFGSGGLAAQLTDTDGVLSQADDGITTF